MAVEATNNLGLFSKMKLNVDEKTGKMTGSADVFAQAAEEMYQSTLKTAERKETEKQTVNTQLEALSTLQLKVEDLKAKSGYLFNSDPLGNYGVFSNMYANYSSTSQTSVSDLIDLNLSPDSNLQEFTLEVTQVASHDSTNATTGVASASTALNWSGPLTINGHAMTISSTMTLYDIRNMINNQSSDTEAKATIIQVSDNDFRLSLQATNIGTPITVVDGTAGPTAGQIPATSAKTADQLAAKFKFNGIAMTRSTNNVDDVVKGLTVVIKKAEANAVMTVRITPDVASTKAAIKDWVSSLNGLIDEVSKHKAYDKETMKLSDDATLFNSDIIQSIDRVIKDNLSWAVSGAGEGNFKYLDQIGLSTDYLTTKVTKDEQVSFTGKITIDEQILDESLKNNFDGIRKIFEYQNEISNSNFMISDHPNAISNKIIADNTGAQLTTTVTLNRDAAGALSATITVNGGDYASRTFTVPSSKIKVTGEVITFMGEDSAATGVTDNPYKGFEFVYVGASTIANSGSDSTNVKFTQGFGDRLGRSLKQLMDTTTGEFTRQKTQFATKIKTIDEAIGKINERAEKAKQRFQADFAKLESFRQALAPIQALLEAFMGSSSK